MARIKEIEIEGFKAFPNKFNLVNSTSKCKFT